MGRIELLVAMEMKLVYLNFVRTKDPLEQLTYHPKAAEYSQSWKAGAKS